MTVLWAFSDEARFEGRVGTADVPWSDSLPEDFAAEAGIALEGMLLDGLFEPAGAGLADEQRRARVHFMRCVGRRFVEAFFRPQADWCRRHGLALGGHLSGEGDPLACLRHGCGDQSLALDAMDVPGLGDAGITN